MQQPITGYHRDPHRDWVAELACGHTQHVRHRPPFTLRPWVTSAAGRDSQLGKMLACVKCDAGAPPDLAMMERRQGMSDLDR